MGVAWPKSHSWLPSTYVHPAHVEVEICRADELERRRGLSSELDEMWSYVGKKANPRWLWHAIDHHTGKVLAYVFGRRQDDVFLRLKARYWSPWVSPASTPMDGVPMSGISPPSSTPSANSTPKKSRANTSICGRGSSGWCAGRSVFRRLSATAWKCIETGKMKMRHFSGIKFATVRDCLTA